MKYERWYTNIINNRLEKPLNEDEYGEWHHVVPRSLGGEDVDENMVRLSAREHFVCHWLLVKMTNGEDREKMVYALRMMRANNDHQQRYETKITARVYERLKIEYSKIASERLRGENNPMYGDKFYRSPEGYESHRRAMLGENNPAKRPEMRELQRRMKTGVKRDPFSEEWIANMSVAHRGELNGMYGKQHSEETREILRQQKLGKTQDAEHVKKRADAVRGSKRQRIMCPHCGYECAVNTYPRFHGDKCKMKP